MSTQEPVISVSNETPESEHVDSTAIPPSDYPVAKDVPTIVNSSPAEPVTKLPAEAAQTASDDTPAVTLKDDTNIPDAAPTHANGVEIAPFVSVELLNFFSFSAPGLSDVFISTSY